MGPSGTVDAVPADNKPFQLSRMRLAVLSFVAGALAGVLATVLSYVILNWPALEYEAERARFLDQARNNPPCHVARDDCASFACENCPVQGAYHMVGCHFEDASHREGVCVCDVGKYVKVEPISCQDEGGHMDAGASH